MLNAKRSLESAILLGSVSSAVDSCIMGFVITYLGFYGIFDEVKWEE